MKFLYAFLTLLVITSCKKESGSNENSTPKVVTVAADYNSYLDTNDSLFIAKLKREIDSLEVIIEVNPTGVLDLGRLSAKLNLMYDLKGDVSELNRSVEMQKAVVANMYINPDNSKYNLAQSYIKQHKFKKADSLMSTFATGSLSKESHMIYFDIAMELGDYKRAEKMLNALSNNSNYNYLIRAAKWNDYKGDLKATIRLMEEAKTLADQSGNPSIQLWSNSNIADYYGHDGQIEKSYEHYLKTLELDPMNTYALKGIAWIVYSHERNPEEALRILNKIKERHPLPDYDLAIAEVLEYQGFSNEIESLRMSFLNEIEKKAYGAMYNTYKIEQLLSGNELEKMIALEIARSEIKNRSTPETQSLLSYALLKNGKLQEALVNQQQHVIGKTYEPVAQLHSLEILIANAKREEALEYSNDLSGAAYELGPVTMKSYYDKINNI
ncbi:MAG: tetratricopeptide (TPR) repeat protein [Nonlabens sp.]|jgi:tetratricopeptide (TPR) repeat protein